MYISARDNMRAHLKFSYRLHVRMQITKAKCMRYSVFMYKKAKMVRPVSLDIRYFTKCR